MDAALGGPNPATKSGCEMKTRRHFLVGAGTSALAAPSAVAALGRGHHRGARVLSTLKFANDGSWMWLLVRLRDRRLPVSQG